MSDEEWVVKLEANVWLAPIEGDPGRTIHLASATRFRKKHLAERALNKARKLRPFPFAEVVRTY